jgi:hypothetical protein
VCGIVRVVIGVVATELVVDVPGDDPRVGSVTLGELRDERERVLAEDGGGRAPVLTRPL